MKSRDFWTIVILSWAGLTLPVYVLAALFLGSWENFIAALDFENIGSMEIADIGVAIFFIGPWAIIATYLVRKFMLRHD